MVMEKERSGVQSVERTLELLETLAESSSPLGISELGQETGLPYATVHRLLATLVARGYVRQDPASRKYLLGSRLVKLGASASKLFDIWVRPYLAELVEFSGETANLAVLEDGHVVYVAQVPSRRKLRMFTEVGNRLLPHSTAVGKVLLAFRPRDAVLRIIERNGLPARTANTITDVDRFLAELDMVAAQGFAVDNEEEEPGVCCLAVPVFGLGEAVAAVSVSGPAGRLDRAQRERVVAEMRRITAAVSQSLNGSAVHPVGSSTGL